MNKFYKSPPVFFKRKLALLMLAMQGLGLSITAHAQQGGHGNTTIFGGAQMSFFSNYNFVTGGSGAQPGVILTERANANFGILNFVGADLAATGASDTGYVDGYVRKYGSGQFIFPVGDNNKLGQFAASADGTMGAYFFVDPTLATTSNLLTNGTYPALPSGGPFPSTSFNPSLTAVSTIEYWDIDGTNGTPLTLTWDSNSAIAVLTANQLSKLTIAGWNGTQWVQIPSALDATSILGGASDLNVGSITTVAPVTPNTYTAYTFASLADVQPAFNCSEISYVIGNRNVGGSNISDGYTLDLTTGNAVLAKQPLISGPNAFINAIGYNSVDNYIWGFRSHTNQLVRIGSDWSVQYFNVSGFTSTGFTTGDVSPDGILYLYTTNSNSFTKVDLNPGSANYLAAVTVPTTGTQLNDWAFNPTNGKLYGFGTDKILYEFDPVSGTRTTLGPVTGGGIESPAYTGAFGTAFFDTDGNLFVGNNNTGGIFRISAPLTNLTASLFSTANVTPGDGARCANAVVISPPVAVDDAGTTTCTSTSVNILANDLAGSAPIIPSSVRLITPGTLARVTNLTIDGIGQYSVNGVTGLLSFVPVNGLRDTVSIDYVVADTSGLEAIGTVTIIVDCPMPVKLVTFDAVKETSVARLSWSTTEEVNSDRFEIERSANGNVWDLIGTVQSYGESVVTRQYDFTDIAPTQGENLYRLRMVDKDQTFAYSRVRSLTFGDGAPAAVYPNPVIDKLYMSQNSIGKAKSVSIYNLAGVQLLQTRPAANYIDVKELPVGMYVIRISNESGTTCSYRFLHTK